MTFEQLKSKATLFLEAIEMKEKRPKLIRESQQRINALKDEISKLENENTQEVMSEMNPKRFFFQKKEQVNINEIIYKKQLEIGMEEKKIINLENLKTKDFVDLEKVIVQSEAILDQQKKILDSKEDAILQAQEEYHRLIDEYNLELMHHNQFATHTYAKIKNMKNEGFKPEYAGHQMEEIGGGRLRVTSMSYAIMEGHRENLLVQFNNPDSIAFGNPNEMSRDYRHYLK